MLECGIIINNFDMKNELIKLLRLKAEEGLNYGCIVESQFDDLADRIVELFAIPVAVVGSEVNLKENKMIKLKKEVVKSKVMLDVYAHSEKKYGDSSDGITKGWAFQDGAKYLLDLLRLPITANTLRKQTDGLSLIPDMARFTKKILDDYDTMHDDVKKTLLYNIYRGLKDCEQ